MGKHLPPTHALSAFEAAARLGSFAVAAGELCITTSAMSHRIRMLEEFLGAPLFVRDGRGMKLTEFGARYLEAVRTALGPLASFATPNGRAAMRPRIRITLPPTFARHLFLPRLSGFTSRHPDIEIQVFLSVPLYDLSFSESDVAVRFGNGNYRDLVAEKLFDDIVFAVASREYLNRVGPFAQPSDLKKAALLRCALEPWEPWLKAAGLDWPEPSSGLRFDDLGLLLEAVKCGLGVGLTRSRFAHRMIADGDIVKLFDATVSSPPYAYYVAYERQARERPELACFIDWLLETFRQPAP